MYDNIIIIWVQNIICYNWYIVITLWLSRIREWWFVMFLLWKGEGVKNLILIYLLYNIQI